MHPKWLDTIQDGYPELYQVIESTRVVQGEDTAAFLCFMSVRLLEMHRILKPTGSIYLHCDHTVNSYIRIAMDAIFGKDNFRNEIVWSYRRWPAKQENFQRMHDTIFRYTKTENVIWNQLYEPLAESTLKSDKGKKIVNVFNEQGHRVRGQKTGEDSPGAPMRDVWDIGVIAPTAKERTGSPDQKPLKLYMRIIEASSNEGDIVLDPFCGCATTIIAAHNLKRRWIGIDRRKDARYHIITRFMGITKEQREELEEKAQYDNQAWLDKQTARYEMHYQTEPPIRTDNGEQPAPNLPPVYVAEPENYHSRDEMREILIQQFGVECWGCGFQPPDNDDRYLHLDHITPKSDGGSNALDNRSILCQPCNSAKSDTMTLKGLRRKNKQELRLKKSELELIDIQTSVQWTREYMVRFLRDSTYQRTLDF